MKKALVPAAVALTMFGAAAAAPGDRFFDRHDTDGDGRVAVDEMTGRVAERAGAMDADGDGYITREEFAAFQEAKKAEMKAKRFPDANGDGVVDRSEFDNASRARFDELDKNGDGVLTEDEMPQPKRRGGRRRGGE